jgi:hypothetical protein
MPSTGAYPTGVALALFSWVMIGIFVAFLAGILLLGVYSPRSGADVLDWRPTRSPDVESQNEVDDIAQMLEASNALRRRRGAAERTEDDIVGAVRADQRELDRDEIGFAVRPRKLGPPATIRRPASQARPSGDDSHERDR